MVCQNNVMHPASCSSKRSGIELKRNRTPRHRQLLLPSSQGHSSRLSNLVSAITRSMRSNVAKASLTRLQRYAHAFTAWRERFRCRLISPTLPSGLNRSTLFEQQEQIGGIGGGRVMGLLLPMTTS